MEVRSHRQRAPVEMGAATLGVALAFFVALVVPARADGGFTATSWGAVTVVLAAFAMVGTGSSGLRVGRFEVLALVSFVLLAGWTALSLLWTSSGPLTMLELERALIPIAAIVAVAATGRGDSAQPDRARAVVLAVAAATVAFALWALIAGVDAPVGYANALAIVCVAGALLVGCSAIDLGARAMVAAVPVLGLFALVVYRSDSRAAWLALLGGAAVTVSLRHGQPLVAMLASLSGAIALTILLAARESTERATYWRVALDEAGRSPLLGGGAGTWERSWLVARQVDLTAQNAHSLYLEMLSELGAIGLGLLLAGLLLPLIAAVQARQEPLVAIVAGAYAGFLIHVAVDWDWQLTPASLSMLLLGAFLLTSARGRTGTVRRLPRSATLAALTVLVCAGAITWAGGYFSGEAQARLRSADWVQAETAAGRARRFAPWSSEPWRLQGEAQRAQGRTAEALHSFRRGLELDRGDVELWRALASVASGAELRLARARVAQLDPEGVAAATG